MSITHGILPYSDHLLAFRPLEPLADSPDHSQIPQDQFPPATHLHHESQLPLESQCMLDTAAREQPLSGGTHLPAISPGNADAVFGDYDLLPDAKT